MSKPDPIARANLRGDIRLRAYIEDGFAGWAQVAVRHRFTVAALMVGLALSLGSQLPRLRVETSVENFLRPGNPARILYEAFRDQYGREEMILIAIVPPAGVFERATLDRLRQLHERVEADVPHLQEVISLVNARRTSTEGDELEVGELLSEWSGDEEELREIERFARTNPLYRNRLLSTDGRMTTVLIRTSAYSSEGIEGSALEGFDDFEPSPDSDPRPIAYLSGAENSEAVSAVLSIVDEFDEPAFPLHVAGGPVMTHQIAGELGRNIVVFMSLCLLVVAVLLYLLFRRMSAVVIPLFVVLLSIISTFGLMAITNTPVGVPTQILPSFLLAVGVGGSVHLLTIFFIHFDDGLSKVDALARSLHHTGLAIIMTSLTTAVGLLSFLTAEIEPVAALGVYAPIGIALGMVYCLVLLPALLALTPLSPRPRESVRHEPVIERGLAFVGDACVSNPWTVVVVMAGVLIVSLAGVTRLEFRYDPLSWLPEGSALRRATHVVDERLGGTMTLELMLDSHREDGLQSPEVLAGMDALASDIMQIEGPEALRAGQTMSLADIVKEIHQALNGAGAEYRQIPKDHELIAQELLLFESSGSDDLEDVADSAYRMARFSVLLPYVPPLAYEAYVERVEHTAKRRMGELADVQATGLVALMTRALNAIMVSMLRSYAFALVIISPLMFLLLGNLRTGIASMVPNLAPIIVTLGMMGWLGIPLDIFTLLIGSIAIGLAVDDTIHFMHNFRKAHDRTGDTREAVRATILTTGRALLTTSIVLALAFFIYAFASLKSLALFGLLTGFTIIVAFVADMTISPAVLELATRPLSGLWRATPVGRSE